MVRITNNKNYIMEIYGRKCKHILLEIKYYDKQYGLELGSTDHEKLPQIGEQIWINEMKHRITAENVTKIAELFPGVVTEEG